MRSRSVERRIIGFGLIVGSIVGALILSSRAEATNTEPEVPSVPVAVNMQAQAQLQGQAQQQRQGQHVDVDASLIGGDSSATSDSSSSAGSTNVIDASSNFERQVPTMIMGTVIPVDCGFGGQAGGANTNGAGFLGAAWTTETCYALKVANAFAAVGEYEYACELWIGVTAKFLKKRRGITDVDCALVGKRLKAAHIPAPPVVVRSEVASNPPRAEYVSPQEMRDYVDKAFKTSMSK